MTSFTRSQNCSEQLEEVFEKIIISIGNKSIIEPILIISDDEIGGAYMSGESITVEKRLINIFCEDKNFKDKMSFIIAHELAHYYLQHGWMLNTGLSYANEVGKSLKYKGYSLEEIKEAESQADIYAGFYGQISGYKTLDFAKEVIRAVYEEYNLPKQLKKYPSFSERLKIIDDKYKQADDLSKIFDIANILLKLGEYEIALEFYRSIISSKFNSREIYNNLALAYLFYSIKISPIEISNLYFPIIIDFETRAKVGRTRSSNFSDDPERNLLLSKRYFQRAIDLDPSYMNAKQNLITVDYLLSKNQQERNDAINIIESSEIISDETKNDFIVINEILKGSKEKKISKIAKNGSEYSLRNISESSYEFNFDSDDLLSKLNIYREFNDFLFYQDGVNEVEKINSNDIKVIIYEIKDIQFFEISEGKYLFKYKKDNDFVSKKFEGNIYSPKDYSYFIHKVK
tara:strand:- start:195 stop:1568 length:1374 start_codon:yes stop_codon:yes gene_type:complete